MLDSPANGTTRRIRSCNATSDTQNRKIKGDRVLRRDDGKLIYTGRVGIGMPDKLLALRDFKDHFGRIELTVAGRASSGRAGRGPIEICHRNIHSVNLFPVTNGEKGITCLDCQMWGGKDHVERVRKFKRGDAAHPPQHNENGRDFGSRDISEGSPGCR